MEYDMSENAFREELMTEPLVPDSNGEIVLTDAPGLGVSIREDIVEKYRVDR